jgi:hypothetical protein
VNQYPTPCAADSGRNGTRGDLYRSIQGIDKRAKFPTPDANDYKSGKGWDPGKQKAKGHTPQLRHLAGTTEFQETIPTPTNSMMTLGDLEQARFAGNDPRRPSYQDANIPTPDAGMAKLRGEDSAAKRSRLGGSLNPDWVEWLMGWPIGWTDLKPLETDKFRQWWQQHGGF